MLVVDKIKQNVKQYGLKYTILNIVKLFVYKLTSFKCYRYYLFEFDAISPIKLISDSPTLGTIENLNLDHFLLGDKNYINKEKLVIYKRWLADGNYKAFGIVTNGVLVYSCWICLNHIDFPGAKEKIALATNEIAFLDDYCHPKYRGKGYHNFVNNYRIAKSQELGKTCIKLAILKGNRPAIKTQFNLGAKIASVIVIFFFLNKQYCKIKKL